MLTALQPGQLIARGVGRHLRALDFGTLPEFVPAPGLRVDLFALGPSGEAWIVECKSCRADFAADRKWTSYLPWCDRFFWAVGEDFPTEILPLEAGLICADPYDAAILRMPAPTPLAPARRKAVVHRFARTAALRLADATDPDPARCLSGWPAGNRRAAPAFAGKRRAPPTETP
jgi:hypothetical protein